MALNRTTRRLLIGAPIAAALAAGGFAATALLPSSAPEPLAPPEAAALEIDVEDGVVVAEVLDPDADPERYAAEFAEHGLDVELTLVPSSPTVVGNLVFLDSDAGAEELDDRDVEIIEAPEQCTPNGGCPVGVRIPEGYQNQVHVAFGREAEEGEQYDSSNLATAPGEALEGVDLTGMTVAEAEDVLAGHDQEAAEFRIEEQEAAEREAAEQAGEEPVADPPEQGGQEGVEVGQVREAEDAPGDYYVHDVVLWAPGEVLLFVGETAK